MNKRNRFTFFLLLTSMLVLLATLFPYSFDSAILNPKGWVALQQRNLMFTAIGLMLIIVVPVIVMTLAIAWRYREGNKKAKYTPDWEFNHFLEIVWWLVPCIIIVFLSVIVWRSSHTLDPYAPLDQASRHNSLASDQKPLTIQVIALQWKWLFIYPEEQIACVNFLEIPVGRPIHFEITSDAPMNSFWIPKLAGQIYAMPGMKTQLNLIADEAGQYRGCSANISGEGFASMVFTAKASSESEFEQWVESTKESTNALVQEQYQQLMKPSREAKALFYRLEDQSLFDRAVMKYMMPTKEGE